MFLKPLGLDLDQFLGPSTEVFLADDTSLHRKVALKFLPPEMQQDVAAHKRFIREARATAALDHPHICHINEVAEYEGKDFIVIAASALGGLHHEYRFTTVAA